ncbi:cobalt-precorrin 5A hydrolase [Pyrobaculum neutrophilum]|uniref:Cobalamin (Vitamin B12) biosynthesis CbiG protein n=1 Tax=Pyrobaculum neutrophilum (strain DSM 2338 / JCM 9278 / NBRC 100436 / V24Sta) TaxID=444157 RepID=B1YBB2_PYRNV|nr:cobalt-precorrin 5A hydrolase [Pyrobaculum neutrophilum]ACB39243.1 cobalamin (vitamin B12) biosynthesis CbiG protein [Pyrobaculum neutrophilum V24Sta]
MLELLWRGAAVFYAGAGPPPAAERLVEELKARGVPAHLLNNGMLAEAWGCYDAFIFVEALGGVVRLLCPLLRDKERDPPVLVVEREGRFVIPLVGSHRGANELARELAEMLGGVAVVTTAVDAAGAHPAEDFERYMLCDMGREGRLLVNKALKEGRRVCVEGGRLPPYLRGYAEGGGCDVVIKLGEGCGPGEVCCRPAALYVGVGARSEATPAEVAEAVKKALEAVGVGLDRVAAVASIKPVALKAAEALGVKAVLYSPEELREGAASPCLSPPSQKALEAVGLPGVAELAALKAAGEGGRLIYRKRAAGGVTVAIAAR